jgi:hypothetical protein
MKRSAPALAGTELADRFAAARAGLATEAPGALDAMAALAIDALAAGKLTLAASAASSVVLVEHVTAALYRHAADMLGILAQVGPSAAEGPDGLVAWAGAAVAHDYGVSAVLARRRPGAASRGAQRAPADVALMLACALGEICERNGDDAGFASLQAQMAGVEARGNASPVWRGHWAIVCAWHLGVVRQGRRGDGAARQGAGARARAWPARDGCRGRPAVRAARGVAWRSGAGTRLGRPGCGRRAIRRARRSGLPTGPTCAAGSRSGSSTSTPPSAMDAVPSATCTPAASGPATR